MRHLIITAFVLMLSSQNAFSKEIWAKEDRGLVTTMPAMEAPWSAVGQLDKPGNRYCTGTLVGTRLVITAAHCLGASPQSFKGLAASAPTQSVRALLPPVGFGPDGLKSYQTARGMEVTGVATPQIVGKIITELR